jgi:hypothetical protein
MERNQNEVNEMTTIETVRTDLVNTIVTMIKKYNPTLAAMYSRNPFNRKGYAEAFAGGFKNNHAHGRIVVELTDLLLSIKY